MFFSRKDMCNLLPPPLTQWHHLILSACVACAGWWWCYFYLSRIGVAERGVVDLGTPGALTWIDYSLLDHPTVDAAH